MYYSICLQIMFSGLVAAVISRNISYAENNNASGRFLCGSPQIRAIKFEELAGDQVNMRSLSKISPSYGVLYRCGQETGCCSIASQKCSVLKQVPVQLQFSMYDNSKHKLMFIKAFNHTECKCK